VHDPTTLNRQGADVGTQYRSAIYYRDENQKKIAEDIISALSKEHVYDSPIVTEVTKFDTFYIAENYHQDYYKKSPQDYYAYRRGSGRDAFIQKHWPELNAKKYPSPSKGDLKSKLNELFCV
jgi:peptide methionine sulfoxide reductase msrA/msrB